MIEPGRWVLNVTAADIRAAWEKRWEEGDDYRPAQDCPVAMAARREFPQGGVVTVGPCTVRIRVENGRWSALAMGMAEQGRMERFTWDWDADWRVEPDSFVLCWERDGD